MPNIRPCPFCEQRISKIIVKQTTKDHLGSVSHLGYSGGGK
jgi:hypothetical protein